MPACTRGRRTGTGELRHEPPAAPGRAGSVPRDVERRRRDPDESHDRADGLRAPDLHAGRARRPARLPELNDGVLAFAGAYHGGDSTRTVVGRACRGGKPRLRVVESMTAAPVPMRGAACPDRAGAAHLRLPHVPVVRRRRSPSALARATATAGALRRARPPRRSGRRRSAPTSTRSLPCTASISPAARSGCSPTRGCSATCSIRCRVFWCHRADGSLACVIAEVHNTYGERHCYLLRPDAALDRERTDRYRVDKEFYVSPFYEVAGVYRMRLPEPADELAISIESDAAGRLTRSSRPWPDAGSPASPATVVRAALRYPWATRGGEPADPMARHPPLPSWAAGCATPRPPSPGARAVSQLVVRSSTGLQRRDAVAERRRGAAGRTSPGCPDRSGAPTWPAL